MLAIKDKRSQCALANGLDIVGDRWTLLIIRDLMFTNRREFGHFLNAGEGISTNILTERLERLQCYGLITKAPHPEHGKKFVYELTDSGLKLAPTIIEFVVWASAEIDDTWAPPQLFDMMHHQKKKLIGLINQRKCLVELDL